MAERAANLRGRISVQCERARELSLVFDFGTLMVCARARAAAACARLLFGAFGGADREDLGEIVSVASWQTYRRVRVFFFPSGLKLHWVSGA